MLDGPIRIAVSVTIQICVNDKERSQTRSLYTLAARVHALAAWTRADIAAGATVVGVTAGVHAAPIAARLTGLTRQLTAPIHTG